MFDIKDLKVYSTLDTMNFFKILYIKLDISPFIGTRFCIARRAKANSGLGRA